MKVRRYKPLSARHENIETIASIWRGNMLEFLSAYIICYEANNFPRVWRNCSLLVTENVQGQINQYIYAPNGGYCVDYPSNIFRNTRISLGYISWF